MSVAGLRKLCAAKDAQIEGLTSRVEVLTDDLHDLRRERNYLVSTCSRLEECALQCQVELQVVQAHNRTLAAAAAAATERAEAAKSARHRPESRQQAPCTAGEPPAGERATEVLALRQAALIQRDADIAKLQKALRVREAEVEVLRDQLIQHTEAELSALPHHAASQPATAPSAAALLPSAALPVVVAPPTVPPLAARPSDNAAGSRETETAAACASQGACGSGDAADDLHSQACPAAMPRVGLGSNEQTSRARWEGEVHKAIGTAAPGGQGVVAQARGVVSARRPVCVAPLVALPTASQQEWSSGAMAARRDGAGGRTPCAAVPAAAARQPAAGGLAPQVHTQRGALLAHAKAAPSRDGAAHPTRKPVVAPANSGSPSWGMPAVAAPTGRASARPHMPSEPPVASPLAAATLKEDWRQPPAVHEEIRALLAAKQSALLAVAEL